MMRNFFVTLVICFILNSTIFCLSAAQQSEVINETFRVAANAQEKQTLKSDREANQDVPDWVKRTNFAVTVGSNEKPKYFFETIQPLLDTQHRDVVFFNQLRISEKSSRPLYNVGFGLRKIFNEEYLLGINSFYDYQDLHKRSRGGVGLETISNRGLEARVNSYFAISREHLVSEDAANSYYEKVANGLDGELGLPLPYLPFLKIYGGGYWYNFDHFKNKYGWKGRLEFTPVKYSRIDFEIFDDTKIDNPEYRVEGAVSLAFTSFALRDIIKDIRGEKEPYPKINLRDKVLDRVVRDFDITVIKSQKSKTTGFTVEAGRS